MKTAIKKSWFNLDGFGVISIEGKEDYVDVRRYSVEEADEFAGADIQQTLIVDVSESIIDNVDISAMQHFSNDDGALERADALIRKWYKRDGGLDVRRIDTGAGSFYLEYQAGEFAYLGTDYDKIVKRFTAEFVDIISE